MRQDLSWILLCSLLETTVVGCGGGDAETDSTPLETAGISSVGGGPGAVGATGGAMGGLGAGVTGGAHTGGGDGRSTGGTNVGSAATGGAQTGGAGTNSGLGAGGIAAGGWGETSAGGTTTGTGGRSGNSSGGRDGNPFGGSGGIASGGNPSGGPGSQDSGGTSGLAAGGMASGGRASGGRGGLGTGGTESGGAQSGGTGGTATGGRASFGTGGTGTGGFGTGGSGSGGSGSGGTTSGGESGGTTGAETCEYPEPPADVADWIDESWNAELGSNIRGRSAWLLDNVMKGNGTLNLCVRWGATTAPSANTKQNVGTAVERWMNDWFTALGDYGCFPYGGGITVAVTGWAVRSGNESWVADLADSFEVYTETDGSGEPQCPDACSFFVNWDHEFPNCAGGDAAHFDYSIWVDDTLPGGGAAAVGGDWGLRMPAADFENALDRASDYVIEHEIGHGFAFQDYYTWTGSTPEGGSLMIVGSTTQQSPTTADTWLIRRTWAEMQDLRGW